MLMLLLLMMMLDADADADAAGARVVHAHVLYMRCVVHAHRRVSS